MKKLDIIKQISKNSDIEKNNISFVIESFMTEVKNALINGENVYLRGFGTFAIKKRAEKIARNITQNTTLKVPSHNIPIFKACKALKNEVSKKNPC
jgi:DNA-binding protein HU-beta